MSDKKFMAAVRANWKAEPDWESQRKNVRTRIWLRFNFGQGVGGDYELWWGQREVFMRFTKETHRTETIACFLLVFRGAARSSKEMAKVKLSRMLEIFDGEVLGDG